jgi:hypothetical protein
MIIPFGFFVEGVAIFHGKRGLDNSIARMLCKGDFQF